MKKIEVIFRPEKLEPLKETLLEAGIKGATFYQVSGCGNQHGWIAYHRGSEVMMNTLPKVYMMTVVPDAEVDGILKLIKQCVYTGTVEMEKFSFPLWMNVSGFGQTKRVIRLYKNQIEQTILTSGHFPFVGIL